MTPQLFSARLPTFDSTHELVQRISLYTHREVRSLAIVFELDNEDRDPDVLAFTTHGAPVDSGFRHALEMERAFCQSVLDFADKEPPFYGAPVHLDMDYLADDFGVYLIFVLVVLVADGQVLGARDYDYADITEVEAADAQLAALLEQVGASSGSRRLQ